VAKEYQWTDEFRGARFTDSDLSDTVFRSCTLYEVKIVDSHLFRVSISGNVDSLFVNGVDVTRYVHDELNRRFPERAQMDEAFSADDYRAMWDTMERLWAQTVARARKLPESDLHERVDGEWSFLETLRHLVYATDAWAARTILDQERPYHRLGLAQTSYPAADAAALGMESDSRPDFAEVMQARAERMAVVRGIVDGLTDEGLERLCFRTPAPGYPDEPRTVQDCLDILMDEEIEHRRYAVRDLAILEER
jgi:uncharacterized damage-inducible protein DinB